MALNKSKKHDQNATTSKESQQIYVDPNEIDEKQQNIYEKIYNIAGKAASTSLGQYAIEKVDRILTVVEKTAKWSLPQKEPIEDKGIRAPALERPCSWIPFLSLIIALRVVRVGLSFGSILIGNEPVSPSNMVYFIQSRRRKLRAIKYHGLRAIRMKKQSQADRKRRGVIGKLTSIFNMVICRPGLTYEPETQIIINEKSQKNKKIKTNDDNHITSYKELLNSKVIATSSSSSQKRPIDNDDDTESDEDLSVEKLLDKYGNENTSDIDDPDFVPDMKSDNSLSTESELTDSDELIQKLNELKRKEAEIMIKNIENNKEDAAAEAPASTTTTLNKKNYIENDKNENEEKEIKSEKKIHSEKTVETKSVTVNPTKMSPKIAQNGNADDEKYENFYDTRECGSDDTEQKKGSPKFRENNIAVNQNYNVKKIIQNRENISSSSSSSITHVVDKPSTINTDTNNENINDNHVQPHLHQHTNNNPTKQHNNKKYYNYNNNNNNNSNHNTYKYTKGRKNN